MRAYLWMSSAAVVIGAFRVIPNHSLLSVASLPWTKLRVYAISATAIPFLSKLFHLLEDAELKIPDTDTAVQLLTATIGPLQAVSIKGARGGGALTILVWAGTCHQTGPIFRVCLGRRYISLYQFLEGAQIYLFGKGTLLVLRGVVK